MGIKNMDVAIVSMRPKIADKKANIEKMKNFIQREEADLYVFGEITLTGYKCKDELRAIYKRDDENSGGEK